MFVNDLADAVRAGGLRVTEVPGWQGRNHGSLSAVRGIVCHHTGSDAANAWVTVEKGRSDLAGPLANMTLERDGSVRIICNGAAWHAGTGSWPSIGRNNGNVNCLGIECVYNDTNITDAQRDAYPRLCAALVRHYRIPIGNVIGHREWAPTRKVDPGKIDLPAFRRVVTSLVNGAPVTAPVPSAPVVSGDHPWLHVVHPFMRDPGANGPIWRVQDKLKRAYASYAGSLSTDGVYGDQTAAAVHEFQVRSHLSADSEVGPQTYGALGL